MYNHLSIILAIIATAINSSVFGYVARNSKNNTTNRAYLLFLSFVILYIIFDCIIIQTFSLKESKDIIVKLQAMFWMPLSILFLNFCHLFIRKKKATPFYLFATSTILIMLITLFSDKILIGFNSFNLGTEGITGPWFLSATFIGILPAALYALYLIGREGKVFYFHKKHTNRKDEPYLSLQLKILFFGSILCLIIAVSTNIIFDEIIGYSGKPHLASLCISIQTIFLIPALLKYNFLNVPIEKLGDELYANSSDAVLITNQGGIIRNLNESARQMFNLFGKVEDLNITALLSTNYDLYNDNMVTEATTKDGCHITISQTDIEKGNIYIGKILVIRDISKLKETENKLLKSKESYKNLIKTSGDIIYNIDLDRNFTFVNPIFEKITGYHRDEVLKKNSNMIIREDFRQIIKDKFSDLIQAKSTTPERSFKIEISICTKTNQEIWMELGVSTIVSNNTIEGFSIISRDITARKIAEHKLLQTTKELRNAQDVAVLGSFIFDIKKNTVTWSDNLYNIYGLDKQSFSPTRNNFFNKIVHPDSREYAIQTVNDAVKHKLREIDYIHKTTISEGDEKWMHAIIKIIYDKNNIAIQMHGTSQDITELYTTRINLEKSQTRLKKAQEIAQLGSWEENHKKGTLYWSSILRKMFGINKKDVIKQAMFWKMVHSDDINWMKAAWSQAEKKKEPYSGTFRIKLSDGTVKHLNEHAEFIVDPNGVLYKTIGTVMDMTELHQYQEELRQLSSHIQELQEKERGHMAREIHDALGQRLTSITLDLAFLRSKTDKDTPKEITDRLSALTALTEETINLTRKISQELRPSILDDLGLIAAIDWLKEQYKERTNIKFTVNMPSEEININDEYATAIFRITQESLTNIVRHSKAQNVNILMEQNNSGIELIIKDDGQGIGAQNSQSPTKTYGVFGMKERASSLGGRLQIRNNIKQKGTTVNLLLPQKNMTVAHD